MRHSSRHTLTFAQDPFTKSPLSTEQGTGRDAHTTYTPSRLLLSVLYAGFTMTGLACVLPGVLLPMLLGAWGWNDRQGGRFFLLITCGSALGPLLVGRHPPRSVVAGLLLTAAAAGAWCLDSSLAQSFGILWGLGLGMTMTAISLLSQQLFENGGGALIRLNFLWAFGAFVCPLLVRPVLGTHTYSGVLWCVAALMGALCLATGGVFVFDKGPAQTSVSRSGIPAWRLAYWDPRATSYGLLIAAALATGVEASAGAWLATYAERATHTLNITLLAPGCLWAGLLCSRGLGWLWPQPVNRARALQALLALVLLAGLGIVLPFHPALLLASSFALGFGLGPLYPALLARVLVFRQSSLVFFAAGLASSLMPWATGVLSARSGLLRIGLLVPFLGSVVMALSGWRVLDYENAGSRSQP